MVTDVPSDQGPQGIQSLLGVHRYPEADVRDNRSWLAATGLTESPETPGGPGMP